MELTCASCKKQLWHQTADGPKNDGYYLYDDKAYCADCWMKWETLGTCQRCKSRA
jgi:hypothetical protein